MAYSMALALNFTYHWAALLKSKHFPNKSSYRWDRTGSPKHNTVPSNQQVGMQIKKKTQYTTLVYFNEFSDLKIARKVCKT